MLMVGPDSSCMMVVHYQERRGRPWGYEGQVEPPVSRSG